MADLVLLAFMLILTLFRLGNHFVANLCIFPSLIFSWEVHLKPQLLFMILLINAKIILHTSAIYESKCFIHVCYKTSHSVVFVSMISWYLVFMMTSMGHYILEYSSNGVTSHFSKTSEQDSFLFWVSFHLPLIALLMYPILVLLQISIQISCCYIS